MTLHQSLSLNEAFEASAERHSGLVALQQNGARVTYRELDQATNQFARALRRQGVTEGQRVGLLAHRSMDTIVACVGILKAGACYLPLDPSFPVAALTSIATDAQLKIVLSTGAPVDPELADKLGSGLQIKDVLRQAASEDATSLGLALSGETAAYVMYTSGSTGQPKGVVIPHRGIARLVCGTNFASFGPADTMLEVGPLAFDFSTLEIFGMLLNGGRIAVLPDAVPSLASIAAALDREQATSMCLTPALFHLFVDHALEALAPLNRLFIGGDVISVPHIDRFKARFPACQLHNGYGPTENTTFTTCYTIPSALTGGAQSQPASAAWGGGPVPIGPPIAGTTVYLLDDDLRPVPNGETGTLWTGGSGVALGYLNRAELTRERFRVDPFSAQPQALMYCTGDLAFLRHDGAYSFLGRADRQVKIGGKRIELDAVEAALRSDLRIRDAVAVMRPMSGQEREIVAFVEPAAKPVAHDLQQSVLKHYATNQPAYMVPARLVVVDKFPLSPTGKIDRALVLRQWEAQSAAAQKVPRLEQNGAQNKRPIAMQLEAIWCRVLEREAIDPHANFFEIGGSSLRMIEVHAAVQKLLRPDIAIATLFQYPSLFSLTAHLEAPTVPLQDALAAARQAGDRQKAALQRMRKPTGPTR